jgi:glycerol kinase
MMSRFVGAIDQGTTGTRFILFDEDGQPVSSAYEEHEQIYPRPGWVEHNAQEIWERTARVVSTVLDASGVSGEQLDTVGITNQRETTVVWDRRSGLPLAHAIVWQDTRTRRICRQLERDGRAGRIREITGLPVATYFSGPKLSWLLEHVPAVRDAAEAGDALFGTVDSWLVWKLTGGPAGGRHVTDVTNASRTMLMDLRTLEWDDELLSLLSIPRRMLPSILPSSSDAAYGVTARYGPFGSQVRIGGVLGDQQAALFGQTCFDVGDAKNTYGTGCFTLLNTGDERVPSASGLLTTVGYGLMDGTAYALEGSVAIAGAAVQWLRDNLGLIESAPETEAIAASVDDAAGIYFVPAFSGLFAPYWDMNARGIIAGLTRYVTRAHIVRATLEAICYQTRDVLEAMRKDAATASAGGHDIPLTSLKADGGASANDFLMQLQADVLGVPVVRPVVYETTALGAAYAAGLATGVWQDLGELRAKWSEDRVFEPRWDEERRASAYAGWIRAVERSRGWVED